MRRKSDKDIRKEYRILLLLGCALILFGLILFSIPFIPPTPYEAYDEKEVIISKFAHFHSVKGSSYDYILTENGEKYNLTGDYKKSELSERLSPGTQATIKYSVNKLLPFKKYAEEMTVNGQRIVSYNNDQPPAWTAIIIVCSILFLLGTGLLFAYRATILHNRKQQQKRDARIIKKYGSLKK